MFKKLYSADFVDRISKFPNVEPIFHSKGKFQLDTVDNPL